MLLQYFSHVTTFSFYVSIFTRIIKTLGFPIKKKKNFPPEADFLNKKINQVEVNNGIVPMFVFLENSWLSKYIGILCDISGLHAMNLLDGNVLLLIQ